MTDVRFTCEECKFNCSSDLLRIVDDDVMVCQECFDHMEMKAT